MIYIRLSTETRKRNTDYVASITVEAGNNHFRTVRGSSQKTAGRELYGIVYDMATPSQIHQAISIQLCMMINNYIPLRKEPTVYSVFPSM